MSIAIEVELNPIEQERFHAIDKKVMSHIFDIHNSLGRFFEEKIYQAELAQRCRSEGLEVHREVQICVRYQDFIKPYYLDLLVERGIIYELKAAETLNANHQKQLINYLLLAGLHHGKLVNFRSGSIESRFVSTSLSRPDRNPLPIIDNAWSGDDPKSRQLRDLLCTLLDEWGVFLDVSLFKEALLHFLSGPEAGVKLVDIMTSGRIIGAQKMCLLDPKTAWHLSAVRDHLTAHETHIIRLLNHTKLDRIHWINIHNRTVTLKTINK